MRAWDTWVDDTVFSPVMLRGLTSPEKRMNSVPWLIAICLSPRTRKCPLGITCITVTEIVPVNELFAWEPPAPRKS